MAMVAVTSMFAVMAPIDDPRLAAAMSAQFPNDHLKLAPGQWIVAGTGTSKDISDKLGVTTGAAGNAVIVTFSGYFGRAPNNVWEWIASRMGAARSV